MQCAHITGKRENKDKNTQFWWKSGNKYLSHAAKKKVQCRLPESETTIGEGGEGQEIAKFVLIIKIINANIFWILNYHSTPFLIKQINYRFDLLCEHKLWISFLPFA